MVSGSGCVGLIVLVQGLGIPVLKQHLAPLAHQHLPPPFSGQGYRVQGYGFRVQGSGLRGSSSPR